MVVHNKLKIALRLFVLAFVLSSCGNSTLKPDEITKGSFSQTITETGELAAVDTRSFVLPRYGRYWYQMKIIGLRDHGSEVNVGDSIIQLDPTEVKKYIIDMEANLEIQEANLTKLIVNQSNRSSDMESNVKNAQASFNLKKLEMEFSRFESERIRKIRELEFKQEEIRLAKSKRSQELSKIIAANELKIQKISVNGMKNDLKNAYAVLPTLTIRTPIPGIFQIGNDRNSGNKIKLGDQIYQGTNMGNVPDLKWMKVNTAINENDLLKVQVGQKVLVRLDATPDISFKGTVTDIAKLCHRKDNKSRQKVFDVVVKLENSDARLKPGMTVNCEFLCKELKKVTFIPLNCLETTEEGCFIYLKHGSGYLRTKVKTGVVNNTHIVIKGDFKDGQKIIPVDQIEKKLEKV